MSKICTTSKMIKPLSHNGKFEKDEAWRTFSGEEECHNDVLYHLGLSTESHDLQQMFGDVKFVCTGGTPQRMEWLAQYLMKALDLKLPTGCCLNDISKHSNRYAMYKVGPILCVSHGMGVPSLSILLHELIKLLRYAGAEDPIFFRVGTCGGIGIDGGTVVVTSQAVNGLLEPVHEEIILSKRVKYPCVANKQVINQLLNEGDKMKFNVVTGKTMCTSDFYEGQGRLDGAFCDYNTTERNTYLETLHSAGVTNIEMEASVFAALTHRAAIKSAIVCVALLDRLKGDQITTPKETMEEWQKRPIQLVASFIKSSLNNSTAA